MERILVHGGEVLVKLFLTSNMVGESGSTFLIDS